MSVLEIMEVVKEEDNNSNVKMDSDSAYMTQLKRLNYEVCEWAKKHINENPYVDLSPVFKDYDKHLLNLEKKFPAITKPSVSSDIVLTKSTTFSTVTTDVDRGLSTSSPAVPTLNGGKLWCLNVQYSVGCKPRTRCFSVREQIYYLCPKAEKIPVVPVTRPTLFFLPTLLFFRPDFCGLIIWRAKNGMYCYNYCTACSQICKNHEKCI